MLIHFLNSVERDKFLDKFCADIPIEIQQIICEYFSYYYCNNSKNKINKQIKLISNEMKKFNVNGAVLMDQFTFGKKYVNSLCDMDPREWSILVKIIELTNIMWQIGNY